MSLLIFVSTCSISYYERCLKIFNCVLRNCYFFFFLVLSVFAISGAISLGHTNISFTWTEDGIYTSPSSNHSKSPASKTSFWFLKIMTWLKSQNTKRLQMPKIYTVSSLLILFNTKHYTEIFHTASWALVKVVLFNDFKSMWLTWGWRFSIEELPFSLFKDVCL